VKAVWKGKQIEEANDKNREGTLPKNMEYSDLGTGRVVITTADFEDLEDNDSISSPPPMDSDPPNLLVSEMPDNFDQPSVLKDNPSNEELPPTPILLPEGLKRVCPPNPYMSTVYRLKKD
jgi:hypothetical protein